MERTLEKKESAEKYIGKLKEFVEILLCPYEDEVLAFYMKLAFAFIWVISIINGLLYKASASYFIALAVMNLALAGNLLICRRHRVRWLDVATFCVLSIPVCYIYCSAGVGDLSMMFLLIYACGIIFILGIRDTLAINAGFFLLVWVCFRWDADSVVRVRYGENIAIRFPYLFVCIVLSVYWLMYMIQKYWVQKSKRTQILEKRIREESQKLDNMSMKVMNAMVHALGAKIPGKEEHCRCVADYARRIASRRGMDERMCMDAYHAGLLHEIGMIGIPDVLIQKKDYTEEEYEKFKSYAVKGYEIIRTMQSSDMNRVAEAVRYHLENYDGSGFPMGVAGDSIPVLARILAVADYTDRHLRRGESRGRVADQLLEQEKKAFEPDSVRHMVQILAEDALKDK